MSSISASLNYLLASNFTEFGRVNNTSALSGNGKTAQDLRESLGNLKPGTNVSARTDYVVNARGQLVPANTTITVGKTSVDADAQRNPSGNNPFTVADERPQTFANLTKPKPTLEPADEALVFAAQASADDEDAPTSSTMLQNAAEDENGDLIDVEMIVPGKQAAVDLAAQRQQSVSGLYARNNDIIYTIEPAVQFAA